MPKLSEHIGVSSLALLPLDVFVSLGLTCFVGDDHVDMVKDSSGRKKKDLRDMTKLWTTRYFDHKKQNKIALIK